MCRRDHSLCRDQCKARRRGSYLLCLVDALLLEAASLGFSQLPRLLPDKPPSGTTSPLRLLLAALGLVLGYELLPWPEGTIEGVALGDDARDLRGFERKRVGGAAGRASVSHEVGQGR